MFDTASQIKATAAKYTTEVSRVEMAGVLPTRISCTSTAKLVCGIGRPWKCSGNEEDARETAGRSERNRSTTVHILTLAFGYLILRMTKICTIISTMRTYASKTTNSSGNRAAFSPPAATKPNKASNPARPPEIPREKNWNNMSETRNSLGLI